MKIPSFLNDLGIIPGVESDSSLQQGQKLINYNNKYKSDIMPTLGLMEQTTMPGVGSIVEAMDTQRPKVAVPKNNNDEIAKLEDEYNKTLVEYERTYQLFSESVLEMRKKQKDTSKYFGQAITSSDGNYRYVNDYGFTHKYSTNAWANNSPTCPSDAITVDDKLLKQFHVGPDMGEGQACGVAGKNVQNTDTNEVSWVDIQGKRHVYSEDVWNSKKLTCNVPIVQLSGAQYRNKFVKLSDGSLAFITDRNVIMPVDPVVYEANKGKNGCDPTIVTVPFGPEEGAPPGVLRKADAQPNFFIGQPLKVGQSCAPTNVNLQVLGATDPDANVRSWLGCRTGDFSNLASEQQDISSLTQTADQALERCRIRAADVGASAFAIGPSSYGGSYG